MASMSLGGLIIEAELLLREVQTVERENVSEETLLACERLRSTLRAIQGRLDISGDVLENARTQTSIARVGKHIDQVFEQVKVSAPVPTRPRRALAPPS
jgi:hypothetical protein